jgi:threonyl-tRNA synthetase
VVDASSERLGKKIVMNQKLKIPFMLIVGDKDLENETVSVRSREEGDLGPKPLETFIQSVLG